MGFCISSDSDKKYTQIPNLFIRNFMPSANGNYVKVYLYLMMIYQQTTSPAEELSVTMLADHMECTENDIIRALHYWQREGLLKLEEAAGEIRALTLCEPTTVSGIGDASMTTTATESALPHVPGHLSLDTDTACSDELTTEHPVPDKQNYTPLQAEALMKDREIDRAITSVEQILGEPVSPAHLQIILYFMCDVGFSPALLVTLYETAVHKGKKKANYIEAIGISWAKKGIHTPEEAKEESASFNRHYVLVANAFGIRRTLAPAEREIIDQWDSYHFADSVIEEACRRTILQTGDANLNYASKILESWHKKNVVSLQDIEKCDESHRRQKKNEGTHRTVVVNKNQFQNFPQRAYSSGDYSSLERKLLQGQRK